MNAQEKLRMQAASALDRSHNFAERGPVTVRARAILSAWLDGDQSQRPKVKGAINFLEGVMR